MADALLIYDADCGFCRWSMARVLAWDRRGRVRPVAMQDAEAREHLAAMDQAQTFASWHLVTLDGRVRSGGDAAAPLLRLLSGGRPLAALLERRPGATDRAYIWVAERRCVFGRAVTRGAARRAQRRIQQRS